MIEPQRLAAGTGVGQVHIRYPTSALQSAPARGKSVPNGITIMTNSLGQETRYEHAIIAGEHRLTAALGAGCSQCGPMNQQYQYDKLGRLIQTTQLAPVRVRDGKAIDPITVLSKQTTELDSLGRITATSSPQGQIRYAYTGEQPKPSLIARPSTVAGKEHQIHIRYNERGQVTRRTETGYSPAAPSLAGKEATPTPIPTELKRTTRYTYSEQNTSRISVLVQVDSHVDTSAQHTTQLAYDSTGAYLKAVSSLAGSQWISTTRYQNDWDGYSGTGRVTSITTDDGFRRVQTDVDYAQLATMAGVPQRIAQTAWLLKDGTDKDGKRNQVQAAKVVDEGSKQTRTLLSAKHDLLGRTTVQELSDEQTKAYTHIPNRDKWQTESIEQSTPTSQLAFQYGLKGSAAQNSIIEFKSNDKKAERLIDDFGQVVAIRNPNQNWQYAQYDATGQLIHITDPRGAVQKIRYNAQGKAVLIERYAAQASVPAQSIMLAWQGALKTSETVLDDKKQTQHRTDYGYNLWGQVTQQSSAITPLQGGLPVQLSTQTRYDEHGRIASKTLPSGERIAHRYHVQGAQKGALAQIEHIGWHSWLDWLMVRLPESWQPKTILAQNISPLPADDPPERLQSNIAALTETIKTETGLAEAAQQELDDAGLPRIHTTPKDTWTLAWNGAAQLERMDGASGLRIHLSYDAQGRRASKTTIVHGQQSSEYYLYEGTQLIAVQRGEDKKGANATDEYAYMGLRAVAWLKAGTPHLLQTDHRGAVQSVTTAKADPKDRKIVWKSSMNIWGAVNARPIVNTSNSTDVAYDPRLRLANQYADLETGLHYNLARYYDPTKGRFLSPDPAGIADSIDSQTPADLWLDTTAYAAGRPSEFFDPDGAAKITYFALTTGSNGNALGTTQGYTKARWAFIIEDIQPGGNASTDLGRLRNQYAQNNTRLLYDKNGNFINSADDPLNGVQNSDKTAIRWDQSEGDDTASAFGSHYGANLIGMNQFTIDNMNDDDATRLIQYLSRSPTERAPCAASAPNWLPVLTFGAGDDTIKVSQAAGLDSANPATAQRIVNCNLNASTTLPVEYENDAERDRVERIEAAVEPVEYFRLNSDCSTNGCPGVDITGQPNANGQRRTYYASYGRSQFVGETFIRTLNRLSAEDKQSLGLTSDLQLRITNALTRASQTASQYRLIKPRNQQGVLTTPLTTCANAPAFWDNAGQQGALTLDQRNRFTGNTQLDRQAFIDMACFQPNGPARPYLEGRNAFVTEAIFADTELKTWLMDLYKSTDRFNFVSRSFIRDNLRSVLARPNLQAQFQNNETPNTTAYNTRQREIERNLAGRTALMHNAGGTGGATDFNTVSSNAYVNNVLSAIGVWKNLRCGTSSDSSGSSNWRGIEMTHLTI